MGIGFEIKHFLRTTNTMSLDGHASCLVVLRMINCGRTPSLHYYNQFYDSTGSRLNQILCYAAMYLAASNIFFLNALSFRN